MVPGLEESMGVQKVDPRRCNQRGQTGGRVVPRMTLMNHPTGGHRVKRFVRTLEREAGEKKKDLW